jgi:acetoin utilization deacetylase AcuC-like enzyme
MHHGNGTQSIFWDDPEVLYVSIHQFPLFPGTGQASEVGGSNAAGLTVNVPLPAGATGDVVRAAVDSVARPVIEAFSPDWILVSCGFDAHGADPLGDLALSDGDFADLARMVSEFSPRPGRLALFLEGGYNPAALRASVTATLGALLGIHVASTATTRGGPGLEAVQSTGSARRRAIEELVSVAAHEGATRR